MWYFSNSGGSLDGKVTDPNCEGPFGFIEVKCPETKFHVSPFDAYADTQFFCKRVCSMCKFKRRHPYYSQVQGQMGCTGACWVFLLFTLREECLLEELNLTKTTGLNICRSFILIYSHILLLMQHQNLHHHAQQQ